MYGVVHRGWAGGESAGKGNQAGLVIFFFFLSFFGGEGVAHKDPRVEERLGLAAHSTFSS